MKEVHNQKYVLVDKGHFRRFIVEFGNRQVRSFKTEDEANDFADTLSPGETFRICQIDQVIKRISI